jgi:hypothetical protein
VFDDSPHAAAHELGTASSAAHPEIRSGFDESIDGAVRAAAEEINRGLGNL